MKNSRLKNVQCKMSEIQNILKAFHSISLFIFQITVQSKKWISRESTFSEAARETAVVKAEAEQILVVPWNLVGA